MNTKLTERDELILQFSSAGIFLAEEEEEEEARTIVSLSDITERKLAEEKITKIEVIHKLNEELEQRVIERTGEIRKLNLNLKTELIKRKSSQKRSKKSLQDYKQLYTYLQKVREEERISIARNIHDDIAQLLATLKIELTSSKEKTDKLDFMVHDSIDSLLVLVDQCMASVTSIIMGLRPILLDQMGLIPALKQLFSDFQKNNGITCDVRIKEDSFLVKGKMATAIYRVVQEGLTNIRNHSKASYVTVKISCNPSAISITMKDNGIGISREKSSDPHSFGIIGMRERIEGIKGRIRFKGIPGKGTMISMKVPL